MSIGTPHYMSPEQARAQAIDGRSDIYSLGIVAYQCLVGEVPYDGEDSFSIGYKHIMEPIPSPAATTPEEKRLFEIIRKMIMKDPVDRFQDAEELMRALEGQPFSTLRRPSCHRSAWRRRPPLHCRPLQEVHPVGRPSGATRVGRSPQGRALRSRSAGGDADRWRGDPSPGRRAGSFPWDGSCWCCFWQAGRCGFFYYRNSHSADATASTDSG